MHKTRFIEQKFMGRRFMASFVLCAFLLNSGIASLPYAYAQEAFNLPQPGNRVALSPAVTPPLLKGVKIDPDDPLRFDFILDKGNVPVSDENIKADSIRLIKYFLAALTVPEKDLWVNLSPYEKDRIVPEAFGRTEMGRDLLAEDYLLKQITASLLYPEGDTGKTFWKRVYAEAFAKFGTTDIPVDTFNKVWIIPDKAVVYENAGTATAYVAETHLKVMLESDYVAMSHQKDQSAQEDGARRGGAQTRPLEPDSQELGKQILREVIIPILEKEVNEGKNFIQLRQVFHSLILAAWYKKMIKDSILSQVYADQNKVAGVDIRDPQEATKIYTRYLEAFKTGVYNYIKEEHDPLTREVIPRKYFSGGVVGDMSMMNVIPVPVDFAEKPGNKLKLTVDMVASFSSKDLGADEFIDPRDFVVVRNRLLSENCAGYAIEMKKIVNPNDQPIVGIYGGSGADVSSFFLSTNATQGFFVDTTAVHRESLEDESLKNSVLEVEYKTRKFESGYALSYASTGMTSIEFKVITELKAIGVTRNDIIILPKEFWERRFPDEHNKPVTIKFAWAYPGQEKKERTITFIDADITAPLQFPGILKEVLQEGIDFYYQRAGYWIASRYEKFIPFLLKGMKAGAFLLTDDHYIIHYSVQEADDLEDVLRSQDVAFRMPSELESEGMKYFARRIIEGKQIEEDRYDRYGWRVRIRQLLGGANQSRVEAGSGIDVTGGIDLTPADRAMQIQNSGGAVKFRLDPARLEQLRHAPGFSPVILNVQPMTDLKLFLGLKQAG